MLRFIVQRHELDIGPGFERKDTFTVDASVPELEAMLRRGGCGPSGFESWQLIGIEILGVADEGRTP